MLTPGSRRYRLPLLSLLAALGILVVGLGSSDTTVLDLLPVLALIALMLIWPHAGEELIVRLCERRRSRPQRAAQTTPRLRPPVRTPHGGRLISLSLGGRAPPALAGCI